jgi:uncharacterized repeat protein (TIGR03843 family)
VSAEELAPAGEDAGRAAHDATDVLLDGAMSIDGRMPWSSNATFLVTLEANGETQKAIYKPHRGERPLWDFPSGLWQREVATYELAVLLAWDVIPRTVARLGDFGIGSVQTFVDADFSQHYFTLLQERTDDAELLVPQLQKIAALDLLANNADRKGGHVLVDGDDRLWGIDNGLCFHTESKLRTVMWDFAEEPIPAALLDDVDRVADLVPGALGPLDELLSPEECASLLTRARKVLRTRTYPSPRSDYAYPWPLV